MTDSRVHCHCGNCEDAMRTAFHAVEVHMSANSCPVWLMLVASAFHTIARSTFVSLVTADMPSGDNATLRKLDGAIQKIDKEAFEAMGSPEGQRLFDHLFADVLGLQPTGRVDEYRAGDVTVHQRDKPH